MTYAHPHEKALFKQQTCNLYCNISGSPLYPNREMQARRARWVCTYLAMSVSPSHPHHHTGGESGSDGTLTRRSFLEGEKTIAGHGGTYEPARLLPPSTTQRGEHWSDGTLTCHYSPGVKPVVEHGATSYACSFDEDCTSTTPADFIPYLPPSPSHGGDSGSDGTLTRRSSDVKTIIEHGTNSYACLFDDDSVSTTHAVFVFPLSSNSNKGGSKHGRASSCHRPPVLEAAHLAPPLV